MIAEPAAPKRPRARARTVALALLAVFLARPAADQTAGASGLPLPRFVSLAGEAINVRSGPGKNYPVRFVYSRIGLPVKIVEEFDVWRRVEDHEGDSGWIHGSLLSRRRTVLVIAPLAELRRTPAREARVLARAERGVIARLLDCKSEWCFVDLAGTRGWMERKALWGVLEDEMRD
ncbi:MAG: SH3 domain-containing protein [Geminicoccaceae bacterium]|nr:SH3 domain-containing protein [Geminicoccaceae bacterium]MCS7269307.1 SH3 domain-containing protein [Geminicoccaceae bacterium]MCX7631236.1 SH3 domain-containing protein [Geminicoccaceae bacterium]MDW8125257.1 SH3 domain-containing protein [Geminicoccaceae bacterium]